MKNQHIVAESSVWIERNICGVVDALYHKKLFFYDVLCDDDDDDDGEFIGIELECKDIFFLCPTTAESSISVLIVCNIWIIQCFAMLLLHSIFKCEI